MTNARTKLDRMARITQLKLSFGSAVMLGLAFDHVKSAGAGPHYNGDGYLGDLRAIGSDFNIGIRRARRLMSSSASV